LYIQMVDVKAILGLADGPILCAMVIDIEKPGVEILIPQIIEWNLLLL